MPRLNEVPKNQSIIQLVYGHAGSGKTTYAGSAGSRSLIINTGQGIASLQSKWFKQKYPNSNPIIETVFEEAVPSTAEGFDIVCDKLDYWLNDETRRKEFDTIIIDDVTSLRRFALNKGLEINQSLGKSQSLSTSRAKKNVSIIAVQDYGIEMSLIEQFVVEYISICRRLGKNFLLLAHERIQYNKPAQIGGVPTVNSIRPGFTGQTFPDAVVGHFDLTWYFETQGGGERTFYKARTVGDSSLIAQTKWNGIFPERIDQPSFLDVVSKIHNS